MMFFIMFFVMKKINLAYSPRNLILDFSNIIETIICVWNSFSSPFFFIHLKIKYYLDK
jgi:hypothetical protein